MHCPRSLAVFRVRPAQFPVWLALLVLLGLPIASVAAEASPPSPGEPRRLRLLTSFLPVHSLVASVAGDAADVQNWLPKGVDPHEFQFAPRDLQRLAQADYLFVMGLGLEGWTEAHLRKISGHSGLRLVDVSQQLPTAELIQESAEHDHDHGHDHDHDAATPSRSTSGAGPRANPHVWLDPRLMLPLLAVVSNTLVQADAPHAAQYRERAADYARRLATLDEDYRSALAPARQTAFISLHNAFPYLARRYELRLVGVVEATAAEEPSAQELAELTQTVRREKARVIFTESRPSRMANRLAADLGLKTAVLETLETGEFSSDAYEKGMRRNLEVLRRHLGGANNAPPDRR